jgi:hypothetical protein
MTCLDSICNVLCDFHSAPCCHSGGFKTCENPLAESVHRLFSNAPCGISHFGILANHVHDLGSVKHTTVYSFSRSKLLSKQTDVDMRCHCSVVCVDTVPWTCRGMRRFTEVLNNPSVVCQEVRAAESCYCGTLTEHILWCRMAVNVRHLK